MQQQSPTPGCLRSDRFIISIKFLFVISILFAAVFLLLVLCGSAKADDFIVTDPGDSGAGTLRDAIDQANTNGEPDTITFSSDMTIQPFSGYTLTEDSTTIDAEDKIVVIDGQLLGEDCFRLTGGSNIIDGPRIVGTFGGVPYYYSAIDIDSDNNVVRGIADPVSLDTE